MSDPLNPWEEQDRLEPSGDLSPMPEDTGTGDLEGRVDRDADEAAAAAAGGAGNAGTTDLGAANTNTPATERTSTGTLNTDTTTADDANDLEADNAVEADTVETLGPENPPA